jgi:DNA replication protein DnaC
MELYSRHFKALGNGRQATMERLNEIMGKATQRRQILEHRTSQSMGSRPVPSPQTNTRQSLPEQRARQGQRNTFGSQQQASYPAPRPRQVPSRGEQVERVERMPAEKSYQRPYTTRPLYPRSSAAPTNTYAQRPRQQPEPQTYAPVQPQRQIHSYRSDNYLAPVPADVVEEWDDEGGMVIGDWEEGGESLVYHSDSLENPQRSGLYYAEEPEVPAVEEEPRHIVRETRMPVAAPQSQVMPARPKEARPYQRMTQPLNPQLLQGLTHERETRPGQNRQLVPQETLQPARVVPHRSVCPKCRGAGFLRADVQFGHPNFGKPIPCECKEAERKEKRRQQLREMSNLDTYRSNSFKTFNPRVPGVQEAFQECVEYARDPDGWLLLVGPNGCGKTHLAVAIANQCLDRGAVVLFSVVPDLLDHLRAAFAPDANEVYDQLFAKMREAEVLVLDDLGAQQSSPWANEKLFQIFNYRYNLGMPTVITANPKGLQGIDERIRSRLSDNSLVTSITFNHARDYRPNHPQRD